MKATSSESVLVVAFDGLDYELIQEFDLEYVPQEELGQIDNNTGIKKRKTAELFTTLITGKTYQEHGVTSLKKWDRENRLTRFNSLLDQLPITRKTTGLRKALIEATGNYRRWIKDTDYTETTLFDEVENSKALFVPGYNPSEFHSSNSGRRLSQYNPEKQQPYIWDKYEYPRRKRDLFRPVNKWFDLFMIHFHRPDVHQHYYGDKELGNYDKDKLEELYNEIDDLASEILEFFSESYDTIVFLSDHGIPTETQHNENAFYSCNKELFPDSTPHITSFRNRIIDLVEKGRRFRAEYSDGTTAFATSRDSLPSKDKEFVEEVAVL